MEKKDMSIPKLKFSIDTYDIMKTKIFKEKFL